MWVNEPTRERGPDDEVFSALLRHGMDAWHPSSDYPQHWLRVLPSGRRRGRQSLRSLVIGAVLFLAMTASVLTVRGPSVRAPMDAQWLRRGGQPLPTSTTQPAIPLARPTPAVDSNRDSSPPSPAPTRRAVQSVAATSAPASAPGEPPIALASAGTVQVDASLVGPTCVEMDPLTGICVHLSEAPPLPPQEADMRARGIRVR